MKNPVTTRAASMALLVLSLATYGCNKPAEKSDPANQMVVAPAPSRPDGVGDAKSGILAAVEPFELLTETASSGDQKKMETASSAALASGESVRNALSSSDRQKFDAELASIRRAQQAKDMTGIALSSNEAYRILVSASSGLGKFPVEVSLLDYAGFRYDANLKAKASRWPDMAEATLFAEQQWAQIQPKLKQPALAAEFSKSLADMKKAAATKDSKLAAAAVKAELDLVDKLEGAFTKAP